VTRPELHKGNAHRKPLTRHDLRATGLTWLAVRGDDPLKIKQRAGHSTFSTTEGYIREGEAVRDGFGEPFPPLPTGLLNPPEVSDEVSDLGQAEASLEPKTSKKSGGAGNRTQVRKLLAHASTYVADNLHRSGSRLPAGSPRS
jgi:hypothetical protein